MDGIRTMAAMMLAKRAFLKRKRLCLHHPSNRPDRVSTQCTGWKLFSTRTLHIAEYSTSASRILVEYSLVPRSVY